VVPGGAADAPKLTSVGAVVAASIFGTYILKNLLTDVKFASRLPVWFYVILLTMIFTWIGNKVMGTLQGNFLDLLWSGIYNGAAASGIREWIYSGVAKPISASAVGASGRATVTFKGGN
jgi:hypothetical protein